MSEKKACKLCIIKKGLKGSDVASGKCDYVFDTEEEFIKHLKKEHNITVKEEVASE